MRNSSEHELQKVLERFKTLFQELCFYASKILKDDDVGRTIVLNKFEKFCKTGRFNKSEDAIRKQMYTAVKNACIDHFRKLKRQEDGFAQMVKNIDVGGQPDTPESKMTKGLFFAELNRMVAELEPELRVVIEGYFKEELTIKELAARLKIPPSTVSEHKKRGLNILREKIEQRIPKAMDIFEQLFGD